MQIFDELKNDITVRDDTISRLESKLQVQDEVYAQQQQWPHPWPPNSHLYHTPSFTPFIPSPNHWFQENYHIPPHPVVQPPDYYSNLPAIVDQPSLHVYPPVESIIHDSSCFPHPVHDAIAATHPEKRLQDDHDHTPSNLHSSTFNVTDDSLHSEKRLQCDHAQPSDPFRPPTAQMENTTNDVSCPTIVQATAASPEKRLQVDSAHLLDQSPPTGSNIKDLSYLAPQLAPQATAASPEKRLQVDVQLISDPSRKKPRRGCRAGKKHRRNAIRKGYITAAQGSRGSQGRGRILMKTAAQGLRGP